MNSYTDGYPEIYKVELLRFTGVACPDALSPDPSPEEGTTDSGEDSILDPFNKPVVVEPEEEDSGIRSDQIALAVFIIIVLAVMGIGVYLIVKHFRNKKTATEGGEPKDTSDSDAETNPQFANLPTHASDTPRQNNLSNWPTE